MESTTDDSGRFSFNAIPANAYWVVLGKAGYVPADRSDELGGRLPVVHPSGTERVSFEMLRLSEIRGRVFHADGTPAAGVEVVLDQAKFGQPTTVSESDGTFVMDVRPGSYHLLARPKTTSGGKSGTTEAPTYHPDASEFSQAQAVLVGAGTVVSSVDIHLRRIPLYPLSGIVRNDSGKPVKATIELRRRISGGSAAWHLISKGTIPGTGETVSIYSPPDSISFGEPYATALSDTGDFTLSIPEGNWAVHATAGLADSQLIGDVAVTVPSEHQEAFEIPTEQTFDLKVVADVEDPGDERNRIPPLVLRSADEDRLPVFGFDESILNLLQTDTGGNQKSLRFDQVRAGYYKLLPSAQSPLIGFYLAGFSVGGQNAMGRSLYVSAATADLRVAIRRARGALQGTIEEGKPATILVIPESDAGSQAIICIDSSKDRLFSIPGLAPGDYTVVAVDRFDPLRLAEASVREALVRLGTHIQVGDTTVKLTMAIHQWAE